MSIHYKIFAMTWYLADTQEREPGSTAVPEDAGGSLLLFSELNDALALLGENPGLHVHDVYIPKEEGNLISVVKTGENGEEAVDLGGIKPEVVGLPSLSGKKDGEKEYSYKCRVREAMVKPAQPEWYVVVAGNHAVGEKVTPDDCLGGTVFQDWETLHGAVRNRGCGGKIFKVTIGIGGGIILREHVANARNGEAVMVREISPQRETPTDRPQATIRTNI